MELLDLQQHKTTIYITTGFTAGFMILLTCLSKKQRCLKPRHCKIILHCQILYSQRWAQIKKYMLQQSLSFCGCTVYYRIICSDRVTGMSFIVSFTLTKSMLISVF